MSVSGCRSPVPTSASTLPAATSAPARRGATCWGTANPVPAWSVCPAMRVTRTATRRHRPLLKGAPTSDCTTTSPLRASTPMQPPQGGATGAGVADRRRHRPRDGATSPVRRALSSGEAPALVTMEKRHS